MDHSSSLVAEARVWESHIKEQKGSTEVHTRGEQPVLEERYPWGVHKRVGKAAVPEGHG